LTPTLTHAPVLLCAARQHSWRTSSASSNPRLISPATSSIGNLCFFSPLCNPPPPPVPHASHLFACPVAHPLFSSPFTSSRSHRVAAPSIIPFVRFWTSTSTAHSFTLSLSNQPTHTRPQQTPSGRQRTPRRQQQRQRRPSLHQSPCGSDPLAATAVPLPLLHASAPAQRLQAHMSTNARGQMLHQHRWQRMRMRLLL
jgi:hypothetical protein